MSKGKLILTDISSPVEGMQVVVKGRVGYITCLEKHTFVIENEPSRNKDDDFIIQSSRNCSVTPELKQIVVEYDYTEIISPCRTYKRILPLHPDDWKWAIEHIGEEVEFVGTAGTYVVKLIHPTPVTYTEEEVEGFLMDFANSVNINNYKSSLTKGAIASAWWNEHKKK